MGDLVNSVFSRVTKHTTGLYKGLENDIKQVKGDTGEGGLTVQQACGALKVLLEENPNVHIIYSKELQGIAELDNNTIKSEVEQLEFLPLFIGFSYGITFQHQVSVVIKTEANESMLIVTDSYHADRKDDPNIRDLANILNINKVVDGWSTTLYSKQLDNWSCGIFTICNTINVVHGRIGIANLKLEPSRHLVAVLTATYLYEKVEIVNQAKRSQNLAVKRRILEAVETVRDEGGHFRSNAEDEFRKVADRLQIENWGNLDRSEPRDNPGRCLEQTEKVRERTVAALIEDYEKEHSNDPLGITILNLLQRGGRYQQVIKHYRNAFQSQSYTCTKREEQLSLASLYMSLGKFRRAKEIYEDVVQDILTIVRNNIPNYFTRDHARNKELKQIQYESEIIRPCLYDCSSSFKDLTEEKYIRNDFLQCKKEISKYCKSKQPKLKHIIDKTRKIMTTSMKNILPKSNKCYSLQQWPVVGEARECNAVNSTLKHPHHHQWNQKEAAHSQDSKLPCRNIDNHLQTGLHENLEELSTCLNNLSEANRQLGNYTLATYNYEALQKIIQFLYGENHPHMISCLGSLVCIYFEKGDYIRSAEVLQRAFEICSRNSKDQLSNTEFVIHLLSVLLLGKGEYNSAAHYANEALQLAFKQSGYYSSSVVTNLNTTAAIYAACEKNDKAIQCYQQAINVSSVVHGQCHPKVASILDNYSYTLCQMGNYDAALITAQEALQIREHFFGKNHPQSTFSRNHLGEIYYSLERYNESLKEFEDCLEIRQRQYEESSPFVLGIMNSLAVTHLQLGNNKIGASYLQKAIECNRSLHESGNQYAAAMANNLAIAYCSDRNMEKAIEYATYSLELKKNIFGEESAAVAVSECTLAEIHFQLENYEEAALRCQSALTKLQKIHGTRHLNVATCLSNLSNYCYLSGRAYIAMKCAETALNVRNEILGIGHSHTIYNFRQIIDCCYRLGDKHRIKRLKTELKTILKDSKLTTEDEGINQNEDPETQLDRAMCFTKLEKYDEAEFLCTTAYRQLQEKYDSVHPDMAKAIHLLSITYYCSEQFTESLRNAKKALIMKEQLFGPNHYDVVASLFLIVELHHCLGNRDEAKLFERRMVKVIADIQKECFPDWFFLPYKFKRNTYEDHQCQVAESFLNLSDVYKELRQYEKSKEACNEALQIFRTKLGADHVIVATILAKLSIICYELYEYYFAIGHLEEAISIKAKHLGKDHPEVKDMSLKLQPLQECHEKGPIGRMVWDEVAKYTNNMMRQFCLENKPLMLQE